MTFEEFQAKWMEQDQRLDSMIRLNRQLLSEKSLNGVRTALRRQMIFAVLSAVSVWLVVPVIALFLVRNHAEAKFVLPAALIDAYFIGAMVAHIRQALALARIDYSGSVTVIQRRVEAIAGMRIALVRWIAMSTVLLWVPITIVGAKGLFGLDLYSLAPDWLITNVAAGFAWLALVAWWSKRRAVRSDSPRARRLVRDITGDNLAAATSFLASLADFEKEER
jgi:hypothetical protein